MSAGVKSRIGGRSEVKPILTGKQKCHDGHRDARQRIVYPAMMNTRSIIMMYEPWNKGEETIEG